MDREGWITIESNRGAYVAGLAAADIGDHYELRGLVFGLIGRRATEKATEADVAALAEVQEQMASAGTLDDFSAANGHFIATLVRTARSPRLAAALQVSPPIMTEGFFEFVPSGRAVQMAGVDAFMESLVARSADEADVALQSMLDEHGRAVVAVFVERGLATA